jgi:hypothetical protein
MPTYASDRDGSITALIREEANMEYAAALLVQPIFNANEKMQTLLKDDTASNPQAAAEFLKPDIQ